MYFKTLIWFLITFKFAEFCETLYMLFFFMNGEHYLFRKAANTIA